MSSSNSNENNLAEDDWAFVDVKGAVVPKEKIKSSARKNVKRKKKARPRKHEIEPDFEVIKDGRLTMSTIIATTEVPPFQKETSAGEEDWGIVNGSDPRPDLARSSTQIVDAPVEGKPESSNEDDVEVIQIPDHEEARVESDTSSTCSFDVIDENKRRGIMDREKDFIGGMEDDENGDSVDGSEDDDNSNDDIHITGTEFHVDFPTMVALFCLTTVLGFVIGHGVGIATSLLVVKTPILKVPNEITPNIPSKPPSQENSKQNENSQLEGKIQKWKSLYRNEKQPQEESDGVKNSVNLPGLKEAHKQLSLENYKLKKAYSDIQKQLDLMKVMSWYRRAQVDKLRQNDQLNMSHVVGILKKELQYLEAVYFREKRLADMWRNEEKEKESSPNTWKYFKHRWDKKYKEDESLKEGVCIDRQDCGDETRIPEDKKESDIKETVDHSGSLYRPTTGDNEAMEHTQTALKNVALDERKQRKESLTDTESSDYAGSQENMNAASASNPLQSRGNVAGVKTGTKGDFGTVDDAMPFNNDEIQHQRRDLRNEKDSLFWRHLRLAKTVEEEKLMDYYSENEDQIRLSLKEKADNTEERNDQNELSRESSSHSCGQSHDLNNKESDKTTNNEKTSTGVLAQLEPSWFSYEVLEQDEDMIIAYENKDSVPHELYGFFNGEFREIESGPGDVFVMSMKTECFNINSSFVVSLLNNSPKPIQFFALLPNGKIKHQKIAEQVKVTIVELGFNDGEESRAQPLIYEAIVMENGKLNVSAQSGDGESGEQNDEYRDERSKNEVESGDAKLEVSEHNDGKIGETSGKYREEDSNNGQFGDENKVENNEHQNSDEIQGDPEDTPQPDQEVPLSDLKPGESHIFDQHTGKIYRHTVSAHQYPISDYETLLAQIHRKVENVYYRFPRNMIIEKFIVKDEVVKTNDDGSISIGEDDEGPVEDTVENMEPVQYQEDVSNIIQQLLKNAWRDGHRTPIMMTYDSETGAVTSIYVTLSKVRPDDVISHGVLKHGKIETVREIIKVTSYLLYGNELLRIVREDEVKHGLTKIPEDETVDGGSETGNFTNSENDHENSSNSENDDENSSNSESEDMLSSQAAPIDDSQQESQNEECVLRLGESDTTEYWTYTLHRGATFIRETVERLMPTPNYKEEDLEKLNISTNDIEEFVSYIYCEDGSVQKTWRRIEKVSRNRAPEESRAESDDRGEKRRADNGEVLHEDWKDYEYEDYDEEYHDINDNHDDYEHDDIDDNFGNDEHNDPEDDNENEPEYDYDTNNPAYDSIDHEDIEDGIEDIDDGIDDNIDENFDPELESETIKESNDPESMYNNEETKDMDKENYEMFMTREWQNLKLRQQQFEHSKKQNMQLQQQMLDEWNKMKQQYREFQENFQKNQKSELDVEIDGIWTDLKHQQKQFDSMKKQIEEDLKKSLQEEWEKLKKKQAEIEMREKQLDEDNESNVRYQDIVGYQRVTVDKREGIHEQVEDEMESNREDISPEIQESADETLNASWQSQIFEESYVDRIQSDAWEMSNSEENEKLHHHADTMLSEAWELSQETSNTYEEQYTTEENLPHEIPYIPSTENSEIPGVTDSIFQIHEMQEMHQGKTFPEELPYSPSQDSSEVHVVSGNIFRIHAKQQEETFPEEVTNSPLTDSSEMPDTGRQNTQQEEGLPGEVAHTSSTETTSQRDNILPNEDNEHTADISEDGQTNFKTEDTQSSSQWEIQIQKLREELDRLYEARKLQRNGLQVVKQKIESPIKPTEDLNTKSESVIQPKCPPKCPESTASDSECTPKCPKSDLTEDVSPNEHGDSSKLQFFGKRSDEKTKQTFPKKSDLHTKQPSEMEKNEKKRKSTAFMDYIEGHSYLRQLEPQEYDHKMPGLKTVRCLPERKLGKGKRIEVNSKTKVMIKANPSKITERKENKRNIRRRKHKKLDWMNHSNMERKKRGGSKIII